MAGTLVTNTLNTDTGLFSTQNAYKGIAKAWVNFSGSSTPTINNSFNVSSVTYITTGQYTINFTTAMPNANYVVSGSSYYASTSNTLGFCINAGSAPTTSAVSISVFSGGSLTNSTSVTALVIGS
jgi:hypothetical protein